MATTEQRVMMVASLENAKAWQATSEKWLFCEDLLECGVGESQLVEDLESQFESML